MSTITYENIKIVGVPFSKLTGLEISHTPNQHGVAKLTGLIPYQDALEFVQRVDETFAIDITTSAEGQPKQLFYGLITQVLHEKQNDFALVCVEAKTTSVILDVAPANKTFQRTTMTYGELLSQLANGRGTVTVTVTDKPTGAFIIQCNETDWQFIIRMASALGAPACANITAKKPYIYIGPPPARKARNIETVEYHSEKSVSTYNTFSATQSSAMADDFAGDSLTSFDYAYIGDQLSLNGKTFYVRTVKATLKDGNLVCEYGIGLKTSFVAPQVTNTQASGKMMTGIVQAVERDKVQVFFNSIDQSYDGGGDWWFPYSTAYSSQDGSGWYSMPAVGDEVRVFFPSGSEKDAFAASSVQKTPGARVTDKIWSGPNGKKILLTEEGLMIIGREGKLFIGLTDEKGIEIISDKNITITSAGNVNIQAGDTVNLLAENHILIGTESAYVDIRKEGITMTGENIILT